MDSLHTQIFNVDGEEQIIEMVTNRNFIRATIMLNLYANIYWNSDSEVFSLKKSNPIAIS